MSRTCSLIGMKHESANPPPYGAAMQALATARGGWWNKGYRCAIYAEVFSRERQNDIPHPPQGVAQENQGGIEACTGREGHCFGCISSDNQVV